MLTYVHTVNAQVQWSAVYTRHATARSRIASPVETRHCQTLTKMASQSQDVESVSLLSLSNLKCFTPRLELVMSIRVQKLQGKLFIPCLLWKVLAQMGNFRTQQPAVTAWGTELWATQ